MPSQDGTIATSPGHLRNPIHIHISDLFAQLKSMVDFTEPENTILVANEARQSYRLFPTRNSSRKLTGPARSSMPISGACWCRGARVQRTSAPNVEVRHFLVRVKRELAICVRLSDDEDSVLIELTSCRSLRISRC